MIKRQLSILLVTVILIAPFSFTKVANSADLIINTDTTLETGEHIYDNVLITNGATLIFDGAVNLNATNLTIDVGSAISADGKGYPTNQGPGAGPSSRAGGSYGGRGGRGEGGLRGSTYGSAIAPEDLRSGGGEFRSLPIVGVVEQLSSL